MGHGSTADIGDYEPGIRLSPQGLAEETDDVHNPPIVLHAVAPVALPANANASQERMLGGGTTEVPPHPAAWRRSCHRQPHPSIDSPSGLTDLNDFPPPTPLSALEDQPQARSATQTRPPAGGQRQRTRRIPRLRSSSCWAGSMSCCDWGERCSACNSQPAVFCAVLEQRSGLRDQRACGRCHHHHHHPKRACRAIGKLASGVLRST